MCGWGESDYIADCAGCGAPDIPLIKGCVQIVDGMASPWLAFCSACRKDAQGINPSDSAYRLALKAYKRLGHLNMVPYPYQNLKRREVSGAS
jgi:hypothetical protein